MKNMSKTSYNFLLCLEYIVKNIYFTLDDLSEYLEDKADIFLQHGTLLKYIRSFKKAGIDFKRINNRTYKITKLPFDISMNQQDENILLKLFEIYKIYFCSDDNLNNNSFLKNIVLLLPDALINKIESDISEQVKKPTADKLLLIKKYCNDNQRLEITYLENKETILSVIEPYLIMSVENEVYLKAYNVTQKAISMIDINAITHIVQTPVKSKFVFEKQGVMLKITSKLAKKYLLKENEQIIRRNKKELIIKSFYYDKIMFFKNILRYMDTCEILAPDSLRKDFKVFVSDILKQYNCNK